MRKEIKNPGEQKFLEILRSGMTEHALITAAIAGDLPTELAADFIEIAVSGNGEKAKKALDSLMRNLDKFQGNIE